MAICLGGLLASWISRARQSAARVECASNMGMLVMAWDGSYFPHVAYPTATLPNPDLPPEKRISWILGSLHNFGIGGGTEASWPDFDRKKAWDDPVNFPVKERHMNGRVEPLVGYFD